MSGLNILGGVGQGLMAGAQILNQQENQRATRDQNQARLDMLSQEQDWKRADRDKATAEEDRVGQLGRINQEEMTKYQTETGVQDLGPTDLASIKTRALQRALAEGHMKPEEVDSMVAMRSKLEQAGIADLYRKSRVTGDWNGLSTELGKKYGLTGGMTVQRMRDPQSGATDEVFSFKTPKGEQRFTRSDFEAILGVDFATNAQEAQLKREKTTAEIGGINATADLRRAQAGKAKAESRTVGLGNLKEPASVAAAKWYSAASADQQAIYDRINKIEKNPGLAETATRIYVEGSKDPTRNMTVEKATDEARQLLGAGGGAAGASAPANPKTRGSFIPGRIYKDSQGNRARAKADGTFEELPNATGR